MNLDKSIGIEIFVVAEDEANFADIELHTDYMDMIEYLSLLSPEEHQTTKVYHGILMPGSILPSEIKEGVNCYVMALEMTYRQHVAVLKGYVYESDCESDVEGLAKDIEDMINTNEYTASMRTTIDDVFVLYGYELELCLSVNADSVKNDEVMEKCKEVAGEVQQVKAAGEGE